MFWENLIELCSKQDISPTGLCLKLGFSNATAVRWKKGSVPNDTTLKKIADYFGVSVEYLKGETDTVGETIRGEITDAERKILEAYRAHPEMHDAINKLLGIGSS